MRALDEKGEFQFPLEVKAAVRPEASVFHSDQPRYVLGFPRYQVLFYNATDKTVVVDLYAYLTN